jgi:serine/threonine protein kinase
MLRRLRLEGIPALYDFGQTIDRRPFLVLELIPASTLAAAAWDRTVPAEDRSLRRLAKHLAAAARIVAHAHERGVLHLDLKPQNILASARGATFVIDWGAARPTPDRLDGKSSTAGEGAAAGTPGYLSPERRARGWNPSELDDVYSMGVSLERIVIGHDDATTGGDGMLKLAVVAGRPKERSLRRRLQAAAARATSRDRRDRQPSMWALADEIEEAVDETDDGAA